jgi:uncharacterized radical SAM superfamily Fe-S cluster-containing enzyme
VVSFCYLLLGKIELTSQQSKMRSECVCGCVFSAGNDSNSHYRRHVHFQLGIVAVTTADDSQCGVCFQLAVVNISIVANVDGCTFNLSFLFRQ